MTELEKKHSWLRKCSFGTAESERKTAYRCAR